MQAPKQQPRRTRSRCRLRTKGAARAPVVGTRVWALAVQPNAFDEAGALVVGAERAYCLLMSESLTLTAVFTPDENGWTMAQLAEWPAVVTCGKSLEEARAMLLDAAREMIASYREEGREPPIGAGRVESITIDLAA